jgi:protein-L-isoaspartate(D-aspartate) O-methyltransferase
MSSAAHIQTPSPDYTQARQNMVESQLRPNGVKEPRLLAAISAAPRELFVPSTLVGIAYLDENIPLISGRSMMQPMILAKLIQALEIKATDRVLDLACATGYSTLVLSGLSDKVVGVEPDSLLLQEAERNVAAYAAGRASIRAGAPVEGCGVDAPFDAILVNGSVEFLPEILFQQLAEGGRLVAVMRHHDPAYFAHTGQARLYRKIQGEISWVSLFDAAIAPAPGFTAPRGFAF